MFSYQAIKINLQQNLVKNLELSFGPFKFSFTSRLLPKAHLDSIVLPIFSYFSQSWLLAVYVIRLTTYQISPPLSLPHNLHKCKSELSEVASMIPLSENLTPADIILSVVSNVALESKKGSNLPRNQI